MPRPTPKTINKESYSTFDDVPAVDVLNLIDEFLSSISDYTKSGRPMPTPRTSVASMPNTIMEDFPTAGNMLRGPNLDLGYSNNKTGTLVKDVHAARMPASIGALLDNLSLDLPTNLPPLPVTEVPAPRGKLPASIAAAPALTALFELLTYSGDTNENNDGELAKKQGPKISNREDYEKELQFMLQQMAR